MMCIYAGTIYIYTYDKYIYICLFIYLCIYSFVHVYIYISKYIHICVYMYTYIVMYIVDHTYNVQIKTCDFDEVRLRQNLRSLQWCHPTSWGPHPRVAHPWSKLVSVGGP